jgi:hypothetical protein
LVLPVTLMLTTAGPLWATMTLKSGSAMAGAPPEQAPQLVRRRRRERWRRQRRHSV